MQTFTKVDLDAVLTPENCIWEAHGNSFISVAVRERKPSDFRPVNQWLLSDAFWAFP
jgi:hypothetical protein